jgi:hypothetical protein
VHRCAFVSQTCLFVILFFLLFAARVVYRARAKIMPPLPRDMSFDIPTLYQTTANDMPLVLFDNMYGKGRKRIIILMSEFMLRKLCSSEIVCCDGTYSISPKIFKQVYVLQGIVEAAEEGQCLF